MAYYFFGYFRQQTTPEGSTERAIRRNSRPQAGVYGLHGALCQYISVIHAPNYTIHRLYTSYSCRTKAVLQTSCLIFSWHTWHLSCGRSSRTTFYSSFYLLPWPYQGSSLATLFYGQELSLCSHCSSERRVFSSRGCRETTAHLFWTWQSKKSWTTNEDRTADTALSP